MKLKHYGLLFAILSPLFSSIGTIYQAGAVKLLTPIIIASVASILGSVIILTYLFFRKDLPSFRKISENRRDLIATIILRSIIGTLIFVYALSLTTGIKAIFFTKAEPYFVLFWFWLIERGEVKRKHLALLGLHIIGAVILSTGGLFDIGFSQLGDLLVIIAMGVLSLSYIYSSRLSKSLGSKQANGITMGIGGLILLPFAIVFSPVTAWNVFSVGWSYLIAFVILFNVIALTMWFASLKTVKSWMVSAFRSIGPIAGAPFAWLFFGETLTLIQIIGAIIVLITSFLIAREHLRH